MPEDIENSKQDSDISHSINLQATTNKIEGDIVGRDKIVFTSESNSTISYLKSITKDEENLSERYISLSGATKKESVIPTEWPQGLIPTAFRMIDQRLKSNDIMQPVLLDSIEDALSIHNQFILLGEPGAGKTTTLMKLRLDQAKRALQDKNQRIPILIHLSEWPDEVKNVPNLITHQQKLQGIPEIHFSQILILLDGLNEISIAAYTQKVKWLQEWLRINTSVSVIISCRSNVYFERDQLSIPIVQVHQLDESRIQRFLFSYLGEEDGNILLQSLRPEDATQRSKRDLINLVKNPFLLSMVSYVYIQKDKKLPSSRGQLFHMFVEVLYAREVEHGNAKDISYTNLISGLSELAFSIILKRTALAMPIKWAIKQISAPLSINDLLYLGTQANLLILAENNSILRFSHQLITEYFAAEALIKNIHDLSKIIQPTKFKNRRRISSIWDEVTYMAVGLADINNFLGQLLLYDPLLAVDCLKHAPQDYQIGEELLLLLIQNLIKSSKSSKDARVVTVGKLYSLGIRVIPYLSKIFSDRENSDSLTRRAILDVVSKFDSSEIKGILEIALDDPNRWVRRDAWAIINQKSLKKEFGISEEILDEDTFDEEATITTTRIETENYESEPIEYVNKVIPLTFTISALKAEAEKLKASADFSTIDDLMEVYDIEKLTANSEIEALIMDLGSSDTHARREARSRIVQFGKITIPYLIKALKHKIPSIRRGAAYCLGELGNKSITKYIIPLLKDKETIVRTWAINALGQFRDKRVIGYLMALVFSLTEEIAISAIKALGRIGDPNAVDVLLFSLKNHDRGKSNAAIAALGEIGDKRATESLIKCLTSKKDETTRRRASQALGRIRDLRALVPLLDSLNDTDIKVKVNSIIALGRLNEPQVVDHIGKFISDSYPSEVRIAAINTLGFLKATNYVDELEWLSYQDPNEMVATTAGLALQKIHNN